MPFARLLVTAIAQGYCEHVVLSENEIDRLPGVMRMRPLWLACLDYREAVRSGSSPSPADGWTVPWGLSDPGRAERAVARVAPILAG